MSESLSMAALFIDGNFAKYVVASTSSHFSSAERQFRFPLEYGSQRAPTAQWTVTGSGAMVLSKEGDFPMVTYITTGIVKDYGEKDANNMGAAMAPAAVDTLYNHFKDTGRTPDYYRYNSYWWFREDREKDDFRDVKGIWLWFIKKLCWLWRYNFDNETQNTCSGGSGCGCSAVVMCGYFYKRLMKKEIKKLLLISTGALMSPTSTLQGESIPGIAHAVAIEYE